MSELWPVGLLLFYFLVFVGWGGGGGGGGSGCVVSKGNLYTLYSKILPWLIHTHF